MSASRAVLNDREKWTVAPLSFDLRDVAGRQQGSPFAEFDYLDRKVPRRLSPPAWRLDCSSP